MSERSFEWYDAMRRYCTSPACDDFCTHTFEEDSERDDDDDFDDAPPPDVTAGGKE